jgi:U3 small nucleolar ribonucleoprotein protein LCP5
LTYLEAKLRKAALFSIPLCVLLPPSLKPDLLLSYLTNISFFLLLKSEGVPIASHPVVARLVRLRVLVEKLRPLDAKVKYQVDKLVKSAITKRTDAAPDPLKFKPRLADKVRGAVEGGEDGETGDGGGDDEDEEGVYRVRKSLSMPYLEGGGTKKAEKERRKAERLARSALVRELRAEVGDAPEEVGGGGKERADEAARERERFEEDNFVRLALSKKERKERQPKRSEAFTVGGGWGGTDGAQGFEDFVDLESLGAKDGAEAEEEATMRRALDEFVAEKREKVGGVRGG